MAEQLPVVEPGSAGCCHIHSSGRAPAGEEASHWSADRWPKSPVQSQQPPRCRLQYNMWPVTLPKVSPSSAVKTAAVSIGGYEVAGRTAAREVNFANGNPSLVGEEQHNKPGPAWGVEQRANGRIMKEPHQNLSTMMVAPTIPPTQKHLAKTTHCT